MLHFRWLVAPAQAIAAGMLLSYSQPSLAQLLPIADDTLGSESSIIVPVVVPSDDELPPEVTAGIEAIDGGALRGHNLFHSFREFHVDENRGVFFIDPDVENILARVTGGNSSQILGFLGVVGDANLFLINPNGIIFGSNSQVSVSGAFTATTADAVQFGEQGIFDSSDAVAPASLTVQPSAFLFNQMNPAPIVSRSLVPAIISDGSAANRSILYGGEGVTLLGGNISLNGSNVSAPSRRIELGGLSKPGSVLLNADGSLGFPTSIARSDISLAVGTVVNAADTTANGGSIAINAQELEIVDSNLVVGTTDRSSFENRRSNDMTLDAKGSSGEITIQALGDVVFNNAFIASSTGISFDVDGAATGDSGDIRIAADSLFLSNGSVISAINFRASRVNRAGDVTIQVRDRFSIEGGFSSREPRLLSAILTITTGSQNLGRGGNVQISADSVRLTGGASILASSRSLGAGGTIDIQANTFEAVSGGQIVTSANSGGSAGGINLDIIEQITLSGKASNDGFNENRSGLYANTQIDSEGAGGTVRVATDRLQILDEATIEVDSQGSGSAGGIDISARTIALSNQGSLSAETLAVDGGNITVRDAELLLLRNESLISTTAGTTGAGGNGGNISIDAELIVTKPNENSDIRSNAFSGSGGNVQINSQGLFGIAARPQNDPITNDITASSELGVQGNVAIALPEIDLRGGLTELPAAFADASNQITRTCSGNSDGDRSKFVVTGRGGLPVSPIDTLVGEDSLADWATLDEQDTATSNLSFIPAPPVETEILEASGWTRVDGEVKLTAAIPASENQTLIACR